MSKQNVAEVIKERGSRYGSFMEHSAITVALQEVIRATTGWKMMAPDQKHALEWIMDKVARMCNGDPDYPDNWVDIEGYARLVRMRLEESVPLQSGQAQTSEDELPKLLRISEGPSTPRSEASQ